MKKHHLLMLACSLSFVSAPAFAKDANAPAKPSVMNETFAEKHPSPGFSDEQLERVHAIQVKYDDLHNVRDLELDKLYRQIFDNLNQQNIDKASLTSVQEKINVLESASSNDELQMMIDLHELLTPEQRSNLRRAVLIQEAMDGPGVGPMGAAAAGPQQMFPPGQSGR